MDNKKFVMGWRDYHFTQLIDDLSKSSNCLYWQETIVKEYNEYTVFYDTEKEELGIYDSIKNIVLSVRLDEFYEDGFYIIYAYSIWRANKALLDVFGCLDSHEDIEEVFVR